ncbi:MAG TPA: tetratricopeptide repeat protein, partial [Polyangiaceae bacterium]|nr:tetratricopeptide repeat protein [Polyangiaceae bacterium]
SVTRTGEKARVAVEHGVVEVAAEGRVSRVGAGQVWPAEAPAVAPSSATTTDALGTVGEQPVTGEQPVIETNQKSPSAGGANPSGASSPRNIASGEAAQARFESASALERSDPARAIELYRGLESGSDSWAQHALYAHGRLEAARGNRAQARQLLERYLTRFPKGPNSVDARSVLERLR